ncbi:MAG TPA: hypothetical protein V6C90_21440 [Coleofasciculaceae cyanobacterium]
MSSSYHRILSRCQRDRILVSTIEKRAIAFSLVVSAIALFQL